MNFISLARQLKIDGVPLWGVVGDKKSQKAFLIMASGVQLDSQTEAGLQYGRERLCQIRLGYPPTSFPCYSHELPQICLTLITETFQMHLNEVLTSLSV